MPSVARRLPTPLLAFAFALGVYSFAAGPTLARQSIAPHYVYLAEAMLHGRLDLVQPPSSYDLLIVEGRAYVAGSPMPAMLLLPFVALFGAGLSDILFSVIVGALNVALVQGLFKQWRLTLLFAFGAPQLYLAALGTSWFNAHVVAILFALLALRAALGRRRWFLAGLWLACAGFARPTVLFGAPFFLICIWLTQAQRDRLRALAAFGAAVALGVAAHGLYNAARFGSPADFGYQYTAGAPNITTAYARYGGFNPRFMPCNLFISILGPPEFNGYVPPLTYTLCAYLVQGVNLSDPSAPIAPNPLGMSVFVATPALVLLFAARRREGWTLAAWIGLLSTLFPLWMYHNTGSIQFGYRYWMDAAPLWLLLLSLALSARPGSLRSTPAAERRGPTEAQGAQRLARSSLPIVEFLIAISIAINIWGFLWMFEKLNGVTWFSVVLGGA
ncbi:MAG TPA: hypothetical protein VJG32_23480 [Anaerolineae bacterium]|nr:hypothetical protein [Anaerolineae bacterium]